MMRENREGACDACEAAGNCRLVGSMDERDGLWNRVDEAQRTSCRDGRWASCAKTCLQKR